MLLGYFQFAPEFGKCENNLRKIEKAASRSQFDLLVLPELCTTGYQFTSKKEVSDLAEPVPDGRSTRKIIQICSNLQTHIIFGIAEKVNDKVYNSAVFVGPQGYIGTYRKTHLFFEETFWFEQGDALPQVYEVNGCKIGIIICFDWFFPEVFRVLMIKGADVVVQPANLVLSYCQDAMKIRSIENRIFTVTANRTGYEERGGKDRLTFTGKSQITDTKGNVLVSSADNSEGVEIIEIDPAQARDKHVTAYNSLINSRRHDLYGSSGVFG